MLQPKIVTCLRVLTLMAKDVRPYKQLEMTTRLKISPSGLENTVKILKDVGWLSTTRGMGPGHELTKKYLLGKGVDLGVLARACGYNTKGYHPYMLSMKPSKVLWSNSIE